MSGFLAEFAGTCPGCGRYIRSGISLIASVVVPLPPCPTFCWYSRGQWYIAGAPAKSVRARRYLHARCAAKLDGHSVEDLEMLALDRRQELAAIRRRAEREDGRRPRRRTPKPQSTRAVEA
jgi:hypothetical protein